MSPNGRVCIICGKPCTGDQRLYCGAACRKRVQREQNRGYHVRRRLRVAANPSAALQPATRICLTCDRPFHSEGPWNRKCPECAHREAARVAPPPRFHVAVPYRREIDSYRGDGFPHGGGRI